MDQVELRHQRILQMLASTGYGSVLELSKQLDVSAMTVRRDLDLLEQRGQIRRTHGGAVGDPGTALSIDMRVRQRHNAEAKARVGKLAAEQIRDGQTVYLDAGSTVLAMADHLADRRNLTVITPSLPLAVQLAPLAGITTVLLGGQVRSELLSVIGPVAEQTLGSFHLHVAVLGSAGIDKARGLNHAVPEEIPLKRLAAKLAERVIVTVTTDKFGRFGGMFFLPPSEIDEVVTDTPDGAELITLG